MLNLNRPHPEERSAGARLEGEGGPSFGTHCGVYHRAALRADPLVGEIDTGKHKPDVAIDGNAEGLHAGEAGGKARLVVEAGRPDADIAGRLHVHDPSVIRPPAGSRHDSRPQRRGPTFAPGLRTPHAGAVSCCAASSYPLPSPDVFTFSASL